MPRGAEAKATFNDLKMSQTPVGNLPTPIDLPSPFTACGDSLCRNTLCLRKRVKGKNGIHNCPIDRTKLVGVWSWLNQK
jgi:hypothetical protein